MAGTTRCVVDELREQGKKVGLLKIRCMRPFPVKEIVEVVKNAKFVGVLEKDVSFGFEGVVYTDVCSALKSAGVAAASTRPTLRRSMRSFWPGLPRLARPTL